jgi:hypothetical protein
MKFNTLHQHNIVTVSQSEGLLGKRSGSQALHVPTFFCILHDMLCMVHSGAKHRYSRAQQRTLNEAEKVGLVRDYE